jgi:glycosyltransferase involved in cell wall biosynthesis
MRALSKVRSQFGLSSTMTTMTTTMTKKRRREGQPKLGYRIAFVCDFFYPRLGGVEMHIWSLSQHLIRLGHKVILITHAYGDRTGVRYMGPDEDGLLKVYYCPIIPMTDQDAMPSFTATLPIIRWILIREQIQIVHAHQATSVLANESVAYGSAMGLATVYTDHSLFGFNDVASVILNRVSDSLVLPVIYSKYILPHIFHAYRLLMCCRCCKPAFQPWMLQFVSATPVATILYSELAQTPKGSQ